MHATHATPTMSCIMGEILRRIDTLRPQRVEGTNNLVREVGHGDFWTGPRSLQILRMLGRMKAHGVLQTDIARVLDVSDAHVTHIKRQFEERPVETRW